MVELTFGKQRKGFFEPKPAMAPDTSGIAEEIRNLSRRIRIIEERQTNQRTKQEVLEQNMLSRNKQLKIEIKTASLEIHELKTEIAEIKDRLLLMIKELKESAKKEEIKVLERYINLWNPINFITKNEIDDIVKSIIKETK